VNMTSFRVHAAAAFRLLAVALPILLSLSCSAVRPPVDCASFRVPALRQLAFGLASPEQIMTWVAETYAVRPDQIMRLPSTLPNHEHVTWRFNRDQYSALFKNETLQKVDLSLSGSEPSLEEFLACFGPPDSYRAVYRLDVELKVLDIWLLYPHRGLLAYAAVFSRASEPPPIDESLTIDGLVVTEPGDVRQLMTSSFTHPQAPPAIEAMREQVRLWPESLDLIMIDTTIGE
jgi:hypothetical protein